VPGSSPDTGDLFSVCFNADWLPYVVGALKILTQQETWKGDDQAAIDLAVRRANLLVASVVEGCAVPLEFRQEDDCLLQVSTDGGSTWTTVYDGSVCVGAVLESGRYGQFGPAAPHVKGTRQNCVRKVITLFANGNYNFPILVDAGDTIQIHSSAGYWADSLNLFSDVHCADGAYLDILAQCGGTADPGRTGDPNPDLNHMRLVMEVFGVWYDAYNTVMTVPGGVSNGVITLQANDSLLLDNSGWITVDIEVCKPGWCYTVDLSGSLPSWLTILYGSHDGSGIEGETGNDYRPDTEGVAYGVRAGVRITYPAGASLTTVLFDTEWHMSPASEDTRGVRNIYPGHNSYDPFVTLPDGEFAYETTPTLSMMTGQTEDHIFGGGWSGSAYGYGTLTLKRITLSGGGDNPFGDDNC